MEWQARPAVQVLQEPFELDSNLLSPDQNLRNSALGLKLAGVTESRSSQTKIMENFESSRERQLRLLDIYLSERRHLLKTVEFIIFQTSYGSTTGRDTNLESADESQRRRRWIDELGVSILKAWNLQGLTSKSDKNWFVEVVLAMRTRVEALGEGSGLLKDEVLDELEVAWRGNQVLESIYMMQTTVTLIQIYPGLTRTDALINWFRFMSQYRFFEQVEIVRLMFIRSVNKINVPLAVPRHSFYLHLPFPSQCRARVTSYAQNSDCS